MNQQMIHREIKKSGQDVRYQELFQFGPHKLRIMIRNNAYRTQCYSSVELWKDGAWNNVWHHDGAEVNMQAGLYIRDEVEGGPPIYELAFQTERDELVRIAKKVLGG